MVQQSDPSLDVGQAPVPGDADPALLRAWGLEPGTTLGQAALRALEQGAQTPAARLATQDRLRTAAGWIQRWDDAWGASVPEDPALDAPAAAAWTCLFTGQPFGAAAYFRAHLQGEVVRVFRAVMASVDLPVHEQDRVGRELREGFFFSLLSREGGVAPWLDLAGRVLEAGPSGPVAALSARVLPGAWPTAARCLARRRSWLPTARALWSRERGAPQRARRIERLLAAEEQGFPALFRLHQWTCTCRDSSEDGGRDAPSPLALRRGRARARARLRALLANTPEALLSPLLHLPALHRRTQAAARRMAWAWARRELETGFALSFSGVALAPCPVTGRRPCPPELERALDTWVLLVALRGHLDTLGRWLQRGASGDRGGVWGRLLADALPARVRGVRGERRALLREWIGADPLARLRPHRTLLIALSELPLDRRLRASTRALLTPVWHPEVPLPERDFPALRRHAGQVAQRLSATPEEAP